MEGNSFRGRLALLQVSPIFEKKSLPVPATEQPLRAARQTRGQMQETLKHYGSDRNNVRSKPLKTQSGDLQEYGNDFYSLL